MFQNLIEFRNKKKIPLLWSFICMVLCCTLLIGTSYAWFSNSITSGTNRIQAGSLKVGLSYKTYVLKEGSTVESKSWTDASSTADVLNNAHYEPDFVSLTFFKIENKGDLSLKYQLALLKKAETEGKNVLGDKLLLSDYLTFDFIPLTDNTAIKKSDVEKDTVAAFTRENALALLGGRTARSGVNFPYTVEDTMFKNDKEHIVALVTTMPGDVGAAAMYDDANTAPKLKLDFKLGATQWNEESDTFGKDYDEKAVYSNEWSQSVFAQGQLASELKVYEAGTAFVTVKGSSAENHTLIVSECNAPVGITIASGKTYKSYNITLLDAEGNPVSGDNEEVTIYVGKYLSNIQLYHNGVAADEDPNVTFESADYHADTGYLTFKTKKFSVFTVAGEGAVARIGEDKVYPSIEAAFDAVHSGAADKTAAITVMAKETEVMSSLTIKAGENITLDLNGCTVKAGVNNTISNEGTFTLKDTVGSGSMSVSGERVVSNHAFINNKGIFTLQSGSLWLDVTSTDDSGFASVSNLGGTVEVTGGQLYTKVNRTVGKQAVESVLMSNGTFNMSGGSVIVEAGVGPVYAVYASGATVNATGGTFKATAETGNSTGISCTESTSGSVSGVGCFVEAKAGVACGINVQSTGELTIDQVNVQVTSAEDSATGIKKGVASGMLNVGTLLQGKSTITVNAETSAYGVSHGCTPETAKYKNMDIHCSSRQDIATGLYISGTLQAERDSVIEINNVTIDLFSPAENTSYQKGLVVTGAKVPMKVDVSHTQITSQNGKSIGIENSASKAVLTVADDVSVQVKYLGLFMNTAQAVTNITGNNVVLSAKANDEVSYGVWKSEGSLFAKGTTIIGGQHGVLNTNGNLTLEECDIQAAVESLNQHIYGIKTQGTAWVVLKKSTITVTNHVGVLGYDSRGLSIAGNNVAEISDCIVKVEHAGTARAIEVSGNATIGFISGCTLDAHSTLMSAYGIYNSSANNVVVKSGNAIQVTSKEGRSAFAIFDVDDKAGKVVDDNRNTLGNVSSTTTCTWSGVNPTQP